jgi:molybdopterin molybdotransferase
MITVAEALQIVHQHGRRPDAEEIAFSDALGRVLAEDVRADRDFPPYHRSAMDGIAIKATDFTNGRRVFDIVGQQVAGISQLSLQGEGACLEVMTGAVLPAKADTVIRYEDTDIQNGKARVTIDQVTAGANIHRQGTDGVKDSLMIATGKVINIGDIGILASVGKARLKVWKLPKVAVISTGDELVDVNETPEPYQVRKSNVHTLSVLLKSHGITHELLHFNDDFDAIKTGLEQAIKSHDVIMLSGGVSKGKKDFIPSALEAVGVKPYFHRVRQRPGKPLWFGGNDEVTVFGFPGNPVSTLASYTVYFSRWLSASLNISLKPEYAELGETITFKPDLDYFLPVSIKNKGSNKQAIPHKGHGSGDLVNLSKMDGFLWIPPGQQTYEKGEVFEVIYPV